MEHRNLYYRLIEHLDSSRHTIIVGPRQAGKSTLLKQLRDYCNGLNRVTVFLDIEHKDIRNELDKNPENVFLFCPIVNEKIYVFLDEIQKLKDPSNFLKQLYDDYHNEDKIKIIATGSSAFYIDKNFSDSLAGRKRIFELYTCSFYEHLLLSGKNHLIEEIHRLHERTNAKSTMLADFMREYYNYMRFGGYPEVVTETSETEKIEILKDLRDSFLKKDIEEANINDEEKFYELLEMLAIQVCGLTNYSELAKMIKIKAETVLKYITVMEKSFHITRVKPFHKNLSKELVKMPSVYFLDSGMRNVLTNNFTPFVQNPYQGQIWENQVFRILTDLYGTDEIRFWRTTDKKEVDFVLPNLPVPTAVEVKINESAAKINKYKLFTDAYPDFILKFMCLNPFNEDLLRFITQDGKMER